MSKPTAEIKPTISYQVVIGDSLSDPGTLKNRRKFVAFLSGLDENGKSPHGSFTNGFTWDNALRAFQIPEFEIKERHTAQFSPEAANTDSAEAELLEENRQAYTLDDDRNVLYKGERYFRSYCEGGATAAANWKRKFTFSLTAEGARLMVSNLAAQRAELLADDLKYGVSEQEKEKTLVTEWSGANDLITVNTKPSKGAADRAVAARIENIEALIKAGYKNFVVMNLPDLGLTPRYQAKKLKERQNATECAAYFNQRLAEQVSELKNKYKDVFVDVFDVAGLLTEVYQNPEQYSFDKDKLQTPYTSSDEFKQNAANPVDQANKISPAKGYMFWDDVHPTATMHAWLAKKMMDKYDEIFNYEAPGVDRHHREEEEDIKAVEDKYDLDTSSARQHHAAAHKPNLVAVEKAVNKLEREQQHLQRRSNSTAQAQAAALGELIKEIRVPLTRQDLKTVAAIFNEKADNPVFAVHQNRKWDRLVRKTTTHTENLVRKAQLAVDEALNYSDSEVGSSRISLVADKALNHSSVRNNSQFVGEKAATTDSLDSGIDSYSEDEQGASYASSVSGKAPNRNNSQFVDEATDSLDSGLDSDSEGELGASYASSVSGKAPNRNNSQFVGEATDSLDSGLDSDSEGELGSSYASSVSGKAPNRNNSQFVGEATDSLDSGIDSDSEGEQGSSYASSVADKAPNLSSLRNNSQFVGEKVAATDISPYSLFVDKKAAATDSSDSELEKDGLVEHRSGFSLKV
jgi:phospholipase/lecithinase/hemolysin